MYVLSQMQYRDCFPGFSHKRIIFFENFKVMYGLGQMQHREYFSGFCMFRGKRNTEIVSLVFPLKE